MEKEYINDMPVKEWLEDVVSGTREGLPIAADILAIAFLVEHRKKIKEGVPWGFGTTAGTLGMILLGIDALVRVESIYKRYKGKKGE